MDAEDARGSAGRHPTADADADEVGPVGVFPSWAWVYGTVLVYGVLMIAFLMVLTRLLDPGTP